MVGVSLGGERPAVGGACVFQQEERERGKGDGGDEVGREGEGGREVLSFFQQFCSSNRPKIKNFSLAFEYVLDYFIGESRVVARIEFL